MQSMPRFCAVNWINSLKKKQLIHLGAFDCRSLMVHNAGWFKNDKTFEGVMLAMTKKIIGFFINKEKNKAFAIASGATES